MNINDTDKAIIEKNRSIKDCNPEDQNIYINNKENEPSGNQTFKAHCKHHRPDTFIELIIIIFTLILFDNSFETLRYTQIDMISEVIK